MASRCFPPRKGSCRAGRPKKKRSAANTYSKSGNHYIYEPPCTTTSTDRERPLRKGRGRPRDRQRPEGGIVPPAFATRDFEDGGRRRTRGNEGNDQASSLQSG